MSNINLLPWRAELKQVRNKNFFTKLGISVFISVLLIVLCDFVVDYETNVQYANVAYINHELDKVKSEIAEIQALKENKKQLLDRFSIINSLQVDRPSIVKLLDMLPRVLPESVYVTFFSRTEIEPPAQPAEKPAPGKILSNLLGGGDKVEQTALFNKKYLIKVEGVALTNGSVSIFLKQLQEIKWLTDIKLNEVSINQDKSGLIFKLEFVQNG